jgi:O-succinylbenzoate synthase
MPSLHLHPYHLPLRWPWVAASVTVSERRGWLVEARHEEGTAGWGDCTVLPSADEAGAAQMRWAIETALIDLEARRRGIPLARLLGARTLAVPVNAALGPLDDDCAKRAVAAAAQGFRIGKIKVGIAPIEEELARLREVAAAAGGTLRLRLDANRAWSEADARYFLTAIADLPDLRVDGVEEPLAEPTCASLGALQAVLPFPIAVDESLPALGVAPLLSSRAVRRFVLKPARLGGVLPTLTLAQRARQAGIEVVLTSVVDSAIGVAAAAHLAAAIGGPAHGLATSAWLATNVASPLPIVGGRMLLPDTPGLGLTPAI